MRGMEGNRFPCNKYKQQANEKLVALKARKELSFTVYFFIYCSCRRCSSSFLPRCSAPFICASEAPVALNDASCPRPPTGDALYAPVRHPPAEPRKVPVFTPNPEATPASVTPTPPATAELAVPVCARAFVCACVCVCECVGECVCACMSVCECV